MAFWLICLLVSLAGFQSKGLLVCLSVGWSARRQYLRIQGYRQEDIVCGQGHCRRLTDHSQWEAVRGFVYLAARCLKMMAVGGGGGVLLKMVTVTSWGWGCCLSEDGECDQLGRGGGYCLPEDGDCSWGGGGGCCLHEDSDCDRGRGVVYLKMVIDQDGCLPGQQDD